MLSLLVLGLLVAGLCPAVHGLAVDMLHQQDLTKEDQHKEMPVDHLRLASSNTDFAFSLYKQLALKNPQKNVVFSPMSISMALAFVSLGARGTTLTEILGGLKFNLTEISETEIHQGFQHLLHALNQSKSLMQLSVGNAMFVDGKLTLLDKFRDDAKALYASEAFSTNFRASATAKKLINDYVKEKTQGKILDLIQSLDPSTVMVLVNYIFFKAKWMTPFDPLDTAKSKFFVSKKRSVEVPMMRHEDLRTPYFWDEVLSCTVVELRYTSNDSMLLILPDEGKMKEVEAALSPETLGRWRDSLQMRTIDLSLPKFSISSNYNLEDILPELGMKQVFTQQADLSGITETGNLAVTQVIHKTVIDVAEKGTEAAAATGVGFALLSLRIPELTVKFNRPYLLVILSKDTQNILFCAKVANPKEG
ncbi:alpha-1-antichymotrypsin [Pteronotus mesoamericanus]|uniref:alpha-1-antichymotrypsin n=1 Tax=Pteronotus mesoamericanus TaxID=1884717 RepID=UPI0023ECD70A|nr:alpha-1-antichymotrypsin [Pteronotus parnellii mesoamericanus]XP_054423054.1 alpha-1-antichymotrypsin [Pteronotus parnellii mesoamericanus]